MTILGSEAIAARVHAGEIVISDFDKRRLNPNSYNLRIANEALVYSLDPGQPIDPRRDNQTSRIPIPPEGLVLEPGELYLVRTLEWTETRGCVPSVVGRSSTGRRGVAVHVTAGLGDVGFKGRWTLELFAVRRSLIFPGEELCQIVYQEIVGEGAPYKGRYQGAEDVQGCRQFIDWQKEEK